MATKSGASRMLSVMTDRAKKIMPDGIQFAEISAGGSCYYRGLKLASSDYSVLNGVTLSSGDTVAICRVGEEDFLILGKVE